MFVLLNDTTTLTFGKYKGYTAKYVIQVNPDYLLWCAYNIPWFSIDDKLMTTVRASAIELSRKRIQAVERQRSYNYRSERSNSRNEPVYNHEGRKVSYDEMTRLTSTHRYDEETGDHYGYTEHMHTIVPVTYHSNGGSTIHFGGPCGPLYVDEFGNT
jgi:hypothetical protein